ncbi:MAG: hypothetical protein IT384_17980 [Deltaproteobacteria bacterium]|nr:hypothetical protein [Deltaproteobacteria bacterium]
MNALPGFELVEKGLADLAVGRESAEAYLVAIGAPRLARLGVEIPGQPDPEPEHALYRFLLREAPREAHGRYLSLLRRLERFERALEAEIGRERRRWA